MEPNSIPGKQKCETLRTIRRKIAGANDIPFATEDCTYGGPCRGTCPKCDEEIRFLDRALKEKQARGETVVLEGLGEEALAPYGTEAPEIGQPFGFHEGAELDPAEGPLEGKTASDPPRQEDPGEIPHLLGMVSAPPYRPLPEEPKPMLAGVPADPGWMQRRKEEEEQKKRRIRRKIFWAVLVAASVLFALWLILFR